jgi:hypothetical protein
VNTGRKLAGISGKLGKNRLEFAGDFAGNIPWKIAKIGEFSKKVGSFQN